MLTYLSRFTLPMLLCLFVSLGAFAQEDDETPDDTVKPKPKTGYYVERQYRMDSLRTAIKSRQDSLKRSSKKNFFVDTKNIVSVQVFALLYGDFEFAYEHYLTQRFTLGVAAGYKPGNPGSAGEASALIQPNGYGDIMAFPFSRSTYGGVNGKFMLKKFLYIGAEAFMRYSYFDNGTITWEQTPTNNSGTTTVTGDTRNYTDRLSAHVTSGGLKVLFGYRPTIRLSSTAGLIFDFYAGISLRYKSARLHHFERYYYIKGVQMSAPIQDGTGTDEQIRETLPAIQFGIKAGIRF